MDKFVQPNYNNSILNVACSIQKYFGLEYNFSTNKYIDQIFEEANPKNVVLMVFDGMGAKILTDNLESDSFLVKNMRDKISSVAPATTTAATTTLLSGMTPKEHGWLGWDLYVEPENKIVTMFTNKLKNTNISAASYNVAKKYFDYNTITDLINKDGNYYSKMILPFNNNFYNDIDDMFDSIISNLNKKNKNYIYAYHEEPDNMLHELGTNDCRVHDWLGKLNEKIEEFSKQLDNTILIVLADHGHKNCEEIVLDNYQDLVNLLERDIWLEGRTCSFKVKKDYEKEFEYLFNKYFGDSFLLKNKEQIIKDNLFGEGNEHNQYKNSLGDYIALGVENKYFVSNKESKTFASVHAGYTEEEMQVPLIICKK